MILKTEYYENKYNMIHHIVFAKQESAYLEKDQVPLVKYSGDDTYKPFESTEMVYSEKFDYFRYDNKSYYDIPYIFSYNNEEKYPYIVIIRLYGKAYEDTMISILLFKSEKQKDFCIDIFPESRYYEIQSFNLTNLVSSYELSNYITFCNLGKCFVMKHCFSRKILDLMCHSSHVERRLLSYGDILTNKFEIILPDNFEINVINTNFVICKLSDSHSEFKCLRSPDQKVAIDEL